MNFDDVLDYTLSSIYLSLPGKILKIDDKNFCEIQLLYGIPFVEKTGNIDFQLAPVIENVPLLYIGNKEYFINIPSKKGDLVTVFFTNKDLYEYYQSDGEDAYAPNLINANDLNNCFALPITLNKGASPTFINDTFSIEKRNGNVKLYVGKDDEVQVKADKVRLGELNASEPLALANLVKQMLDGITTAFNSHTHIATSLGSPTTPPATPITQSNQVKSNKVYGV
jgi:hypothetical protein